MNRNSVFQLGRNIARRMIILAVILGGVVLAANAQEEIEERTKWGIKGGVNISTLSFNIKGGGTVDNKSIAGAVLGVTLNHAITPKWYIHSGLEFSMKGFELELSSTVNAKAYFIEVPVAVGYKFNIGKGWTIEPRAGLYFAYGVAGNTSISGSSVDLKTFGDKILKPFDAGALVGVFFDNNQFVIGLQGEFGITEANGNSLTVTGATAHNSNFSISVGYLF